MTVTASRAGPAGVRVHRRPSARTEDPCPGRRRGQDRRRPGGAAGGPGDQGDRHRARWQAGARRGADRRRIERDGRAFRGELARSAHLQPGRTGTFALEDVGKGPHTVWASHPDHPEARAQGRGAGRRRRVKLAFPPDTSVSGLVVAPERQADRPLHHHHLARTQGRRDAGRTGGARQMAAFDARVAAGAEPGRHVRGAPAGGGQPRAARRRRRRGERHPGGHPPGGRAKDRPAHPAAARGAGDRTGGRARQRQADRRAPRSTPGPGRRPGRGRGRRPTGASCSKGRPWARPSGCRFRPTTPATSASSRRSRSSPGRPAIDAGTIALLPGNARERWGMDPADRGRAGGQREDRERPGDGAAAWPRTAPPPGRVSRRATCHLHQRHRRTAELGNGALSYLSSGKPGASVTLVVETPGAAPARTVTVTLEPGKPTAPRSN